MASSPPGTGTRLDPRKRPPLARSEPRKEQETEAEWRERHRTAVFDHYGRVCACCGSTEDLTIDHIDGSGAEHRAELFKDGRMAGWHFYVWLVRTDSLTAIRRSVVRATTPSGPASAAASTMRGSRRERRLGNPLDSRRRCRRCCRRGRYVSYFHAVEVVTSNGEPAHHRTPVSGRIDGLIIAASAVLLDAARHGEDAPRSGVVAARFRHRRNARREHHLRCPPRPRRRPVGRMARARFRRLLRTLDCCWPEHPRGVRRTMVTPRFRRPSRAPPKLPPRHRCAPRWPLATRGRSTRCRHSSVSPAPRRRDCAAACSLRPTGTHPTRIRLTTRKQPAAGRLPLEANPAAGPLPKEVTHHGRAAV